MDGVRSQGQRVSIGTFSPTGIASSFFSCAVAVRLIVCARITLATALDMRVETLWVG